MTMFTESFDLEPGHSLWISFVNNTNRTIKGPAKLVYDNGTVTLLDGKKILAFKDEHVVWFEYRPASED